MAARIDDLHDYDLSQDAFDAIRTRGPLPFVMALFDQHVRHWAGVVELYHSLYPTGKEDGAALARGAIGRGAKVEERFHDEIHSLKELARNMGVDVSGGPSYGMPKESLSFAFLIEHALGARSQTDRTPSAQALEAMRDAWIKLPTTAAGERASEFVHRDLNINYDTLVPPYSRMADMLERKFDRSGPEHRLVSKLIIAGAEIDGINIPGIAGQPR